MKKVTLVSVICGGGLLLTSAFAQAPGAGSSPNPSHAPETEKQQLDPAQNPGNQPSSKVDDKKFVREAAMGGLTEVELGKLAAQKASAENVKQFAQKMVDDHTKANNQLKQVAARNNIQIPDTLDAKHQAQIDRLSKLSGEEFDKAYVKDQVKDHETDVRAFSDEAQEGNDPAVKAFASSTLPTLQQHLQMVKSLDKSEKQVAKTEQ